MPERRTSGHRPAGLAGDQPADPLQIISQHGLDAGTGRSAMVPDMTVAGKTGTVQNPHGVDHSTFIAFAPVEDPQIALAVYVENSGGGGRYAAPIAGLLIEKYMRGSISPQKQFYERLMLEANLIEKP